MTVYKNVTITTIAYPCNATATLRCLNKVAKDPTDQQCGAPVKPTYRLLCKSNKNINIYLNNLSEYLAYAWSLRDEQHRQNIRTPTGDIFLLLRCWDPSLLSAISIGAPWANLSKTYCKCLYVYYQLYSHNRKCTYTYIKSACHLGKICEM